MMIMILSMIIGSYDEWVHSVFFYRFQVLEKLNLIMKNSQTDQVTWVDHRHVRLKSCEKLQLKLKYHLLRRKYYILKKVLYFRVSAAY